MNLCFIKGKIVSEIEFKFLYKSNNISICIFEIKLTNGSVIKVKAYDKYADFAYSKLNIGGIIWISGYIENNIIIIDGFETLI